MTPAGVGGLGSAAVCLAVAAAAQNGGAGPQAYSERIEVIARSVLVDVLDDTGQAVDEVPAGLLTLFEDGVPRQVLDVRRRAVEGAGGIELATAAGEPARQAVRPAPRFVLVAIDPETLGRRAWATAIEHLQGAADSLVRIGPVDVVALTAPPLVVALGIRDQAEVRAALARIRADVVPLDRYYAERARTIDELQQLRQDAAVRGRDLVQQAAALERELAAEEERALRNALERLRAAASPRGRPLVAVWAAQGDPDTAAFVRAQLPRSLSSEDEVQLRSAPLGFLATLESSWARWAADGISVVSWTKPADSLAFETASRRRPVAGSPLTALGMAPLALFEALAEATGGAVAQTRQQLRAGLAIAGGRLDVTYQTSRSDSGWRILRIQASRPGWSVRYPPRILVTSSEPRAHPGWQPVVLAVKLAPERFLSQQPGREKVRLPVAIDLTPLHERLGHGTPAVFAIRVLATPPGGATVSREVEVRVAALPEQGILRYEASLEVPAGTSSFAVEVREENSGALGAAGPVDAPPPAGGASSPIPAAVPVPTAPPGDFSDSTEVRIGQARFLLPEAGMPADGSVRVVWRTRDQKLVRVAGGAGSSLELGIAIDVSESVTAEREAFRRAAAAAATRLLGDGDRVFRVDFGSVPRYLGGSRGGLGALLETNSAARAERTAILDAVRFSLERFSGSTDRAALIVLTDGVQTTGGGDWRAVLRLAKARAIPIIVVMTPARETRAAPALPDAALVNSFTNPSPRVGLALEEDMRSGLGPEAAWRLVVSRIATESGGIVVDLSTAEHATGVWSVVEAALARLWVAVFEPSDPNLDPREVEVRTASGGLLRPGS